MDKYVSLEELRLWDPDEEWVEKIQEQFANNDFCYLSNQEKLLGIVLSPIIKDYLCLRKWFVQVACGKDCLYLGSNLENDHFKCQVFDRYDLFCIFDQLLLEKINDVYGMNFKSDEEFVLPVKFELKTYLGKPVVTINMRAMEE